MKMQLDLGNHVRCDDCNEDYTNSDAVGGLLFESKGYCPNRTPKILELARKYGEERYIRARANPGERFRDFILRIRGGNNMATVTSPEKDCQEWMAIIATNMGVANPFNEPYEDDEK